VLGGQAMGKTAGVPVAVKVDTVPPASRPIGVARIGGFPLAGAKNLISRRLNFD